MGLQDENRQNINPQRARALLLCIDGLRFACGICAASYERALHRLRSFEATETIKAGVPRGEAMLAVADIWSVVDSAHRVRILVPRTPHLKKSSPLVEAFLRGTNDVEKMRNYIQHLDNEITALSEPSTPLWGSISWQTALDPTKQITLITGTRHLQYSAVSLVYDTIENKFVHTLELVVGNDTLDVPGVVRWVARLNELLREWTATFELGNTERYEYEPQLVSLMMMTMERSTK